MSEEINKDSMEVSAAQNETNNQPVVNSSEKEQSIDNNEKAKELRNLIFFKSIYTEQFISEAETLFDKTLLSFAINNEKDNISELSKKLRHLIAEDDISKIVQTSEFKAIKKDFYYEYLYKIMEIKLEFDNKIKEKYGKELHSVFSRYFSQSMAEIWDSEGKNAIEINRIENLLKEKSQNLSDLEEEFEIELETIPKISKIDLGIFDEKQDSEEIEEIEGDIDKQVESHNQVENMRMPQMKKEGETESFSSPTEHVKPIKPIKPIKRIDRYDA
jgi:hypothetical protein